jgi:AcrR family transcriptional regulator
VPKLWTETIEEHRRAVHDATLDTTAALVREHGLAAVTMSQIAAAAGIGRATLYKYFPDVEAILVAWHDRHIARHLRQLAEARDAAPPAGRLEAVLEAFALIQHQHHDTELPVALLHRGEHVARARRQLQDLVSELLAESAGAGSVRHRARRAGRLLPARPDRRRKPALGNGRPPAPRRHHGGTAPAARPVRPAIRASPSRCAAGLTAATERGHVLTERICIRSLAMCSSYTGEH